MEKNDFSKFLNKQVVIGVPHLQKDNALFYYYGVLTDLNVDSLVLETKKGLLMISFDRIKQIKEEDRR